MGEAGWEKILLRDFLMMLVTLQELPKESIQTVEMRQHAADEEPLSPEELREKGFYHPRLVRILPSEAGALHSGLQRG